MREACVRVDAPARLHLGFIDPSGSLGRRWGSVGIAIDGLSTRIDVALSREDHVEACTPQGHAAIERVHDFLARLRGATGAAAPLQVILREAPPAHAGFGSGTQLALAIGRAFALLHGLPLTTSALAKLLARGARSGVGIAGFDHGGLMVDAGPRHDGAPAPVVSHLEFPESWRIVLALDERQSGLHGGEEAYALERLPAFSQGRAADISHRLMMQLLPAVAEAEFDAFAQALTAIQMSIGGYFAPAQGGSMYTSAAVARCLEWVAQRFVAGVGQSSWGPTGFAFVSSQHVAERVLEEARAAGVIDKHLRLSVVSASNRGARVSALSSETEPR